MKNPIASALLSASIIGAIILLPSCMAAPEDIKKEPVYKIEKREALNFKRIDASGALNLEVTANKGFSVEIETEENSLKNIITRVNDETLEIYPDKQWQSEKYMVKARISLPHLDGIVISGSSKVNIPGIENDKLDMQLNGSSQISISGNAKNLAATGNGASKIEAFGLKCSNVNIELNGASQAEIFVTDELTSSTAGATTLTYDGNPKRLKKNSTAGSIIKSR